MSNASGSNRSLIRAVLIVAFGFVTSGILGLVRQAIVSAIFGTSDASDAFAIAQRLPELVFTLVAGGALASAFIPTFTRAQKDDPQQAWQLARAVIILSTIAAAALSLVVVLIAPPLVQNVLASGKSPTAQALIIDLLRIMMLTPAIFSVSGLIMGILQTHGQFWLSSLAISMNSIGIIIGALFFAQWIPAPAGSIAVVDGANVYGLAWGAVLSAALHLLVQLPGLWKLPRSGQDGRGKPTPLQSGWELWRIPGVMMVLKLMGPRVLGLGVAQINFIVNAALASGMGAGSYTALTSAWTLMFFALGIIGQSVGTAVFPALSALAAENNLEGFKDRLAGALRSVLFVAIPATFGLLLLGQPIIAVLFQRRAWTAESTAATAWALAFFALGIAGHASLEVLSRAFYALSDTWTPVWVGVVSLLANIGLSFAFIRVVGDPLDFTHGAFAGVALANSLTTLLEALVLWVLLRRRIGDLRDAYLWGGLWRTLAAAAAMGAALLINERVLEGQAALIRVLTGGAVAVVIFAGISLALGVDELSAIVGLVRRRLRR